MQIGALRALLLSFTFEKIKNSQYTAIEQQAALKLLCEFLI
jgi:hypothetical protein